jgi:hypothetical protein
VPRTFLMIDALRVNFALALGAALLFACTESPAAAAAAQVSVEVPNGKTKTVRLRNLPRGTLLSVRVRASGRLQIALISAVQLKSRKPEALFRGALERSLRFQVMLPESSDYYLVLDNRRGDEPIKARATINVEKVPAVPQAPGQREEKSDGEFDEARAAGAPNA